MKIDLRKTEKSEGLSRKQSSHIWCFANQTSFPLTAQDSGGILILQAAMPPQSRWSSQTSVTHQTGWEVELSITSLVFSQEWKESTGYPLVWKILPVSISSKGGNANTFFSYRLAQQGQLLMVFLLIHLSCGFFCRKELSQSWVLAELPKFQLCGTAWSHSAEVLSFK